MNDHEQGTVLTGGTGFLGGEVLVRLLERDDAPVYVLVRARDGEEANARLETLLDSLLGSAEPWSDRATAVRGDLGQPWLGMSSRDRDWLAERADRIIHCAASVSFTMGLDEQRRINVDGTRRMIELAGHCTHRGGLESFVHVSTAYVAGTHSGTFREDDLDVGQSFRNAYERTKFEAELLVRRSRELPVQAMRPSIVVGDSRTGWIPARRSAPVDVVPVDFVADAVLALAGRSGNAYNLTAGNRASSVGELIELGSAAASKPRPRVLPPWVYRRLIHPLLVRSGSEARRRALRRSEVYFPYFAMRTRYDNSTARKALAPAGIEAPPLASYFHRLLSFAQAADWGRRPVARHEVIPSRPAARTAADPLFAA